MSQAKKEGKSGQKIGRAKRRPSTASYAIRHERNKVRRLSKENRLQAFYAARVLKVPHGTARRLRRVALQRVTYE